MAEASGPHAGLPVMQRGAGLGDGRAVAIMVHGRNAGPRNILELADLLPNPGFTYLAPAAAGNTWYPLSFLSEIERNEPGLSSGLSVIDSLVIGAEAAGVPRQRILLLGFSQGGCLASEYLVRQSGRFGGLAALSGGLIGPPGTRWESPGSLEGTPVFLGCSDQDTHVPAARVIESGEVFARRGAAVTRRLYPGLGHEINEEELIWIRGLMKDLAGPP